MMATVDEFLYTTTAARDERYEDVYYQEPDDILVFWSILDTKGRRQYQRTTSKDRFLTMRRERKWSKRKMKRNSHLLR